MADLRTWLSGVRRGDLVSSRGEATYVGMAELATRTGGYGRRLTTWGLHTARFGGQ